MPDRFDSECLHRGSDRGKVSANRRGRVRVGVGSANRRRFQPDRVRRSFGPQYAAGSVCAARCFDQVRINVCCRASAISAGLGQGARQTAVREAAARGGKDHNRRKRKLPLRKRSQCGLGTRNDHFGYGLVAPHLVHRANRSVHGRVASEPFCGWCGCAATARR